MPHAAGLFYEIHGHANAPALVLASGLDGSASYWAPNTPALAEHFRVIAYDQRGTGRSDRTLPDETSVEDMAGDVIALLDSLDIERASCIGHALGGMIGIELAIRTNRIEAVVAINAWRDLDPHTRRCFDVRLELLRNSGPAAYIHAQPLFLFPPDWISRHDTELREEARHQLASLPDAATIEKRIAAVQAYRPIPLDLYATTKWLVRELANSLGGAKFVALEWGGHACNVTDPGTFNGIVLDFLRS
jgi:aminoacrylate hydrolase